MVADVASTGLSSIVLSLLMVVALVVLALEVPLSIVASTLILPAIVALEAFASAVGLVSSKAALVASIASVALLLVVPSWSCLGVLDPHHLPSDPLSVQAGDGLVRLRLSGHLNEAEDASVLLPLEEKVHNLSAILKERSQFSLIDLHRQAFTSVASPQMKSRLEGSVS